MRTVSRHFDTKGSIYMGFFVGLNPLKVKIDLTGMDSFSFILQFLASFLSNFPSIIYINVQECRSIPAWERRRQALCLMAFVTGEWALKGSSVAASRQNTKWTVVGKRLWTTRAFVTRLHCAKNQSDVSKRSLFFSAARPRYFSEMTSLAQHPEHKSSRSTRILFSYFVIFTINKNNSEYL